MIQERIPVSYNGAHRYDIVIAEGFGDLAGELVKAGAEGRRLLIVTETRVADLCLEDVRREAVKVSPVVRTHIFPAGEENKTLDTVRGIYEVLIRERFDRKDFILALGGGVTGDICGYAAATYLRGIRFVQIPTTLLSQVDSSVGGKTGVDFSSYKNMVGAFHMPELVYTDITTLKTLPEREFASGMGEIIKHGLIADPGYYGLLFSERERILGRDASVLAEVVSGSVRIKRGVVEEDPTEKGIRATLNFGHTLGHAIEKDCAFTLSHGACVGLGCLAAVSITEKRGLVPEGTRERLKELMAYYGLPVSYRAESTDRIVTDTKNDKKMDRGTIRFILLERIGRASIVTDVSDGEMKAALEELNNG